MKAWAYACWIGAFGLVATWIQLLSPTYYDSDTGYHLAVARLLRQHGILYEFPWTPFSWLAEHYADKELFFHLLLTPVASLEPNLAGRIAGAALGTLLLAVLFTILVRERVPSAGFWTLLALASSSGFVLRFSLLRPHLLSIPLALLIIWAGVRRRWLVLGLSCFLYPLCYTAWHLPLVLLGLAELARLLSERRVDWRVPSLGFAAIALAVLVHATFSNNLELFWIQNFEVLFATAWAGRGGFDLGPEFRPFQLAHIHRFALLPAALACAALVLAWRARRRDALPLAAALAAIGFLAVTLRSQRFLEYLAPFAALALALGCAATPRVATWRDLAAGLFAASCLYTGLLGSGVFDRMAQRLDPFPPAVAEELRRAIPAGETVFTCDWDITGRMMLALPERRFLVALDPVFFAKADLARYQVWYDLVRTPPRRPAALLRDTFGTRYVLCSGRRRAQALALALAADPGARLLHQSKGAIAFEIAPAPPRAASAEPKTGS